MSETSAAPSIWSRTYLRSQLENALLAPIRSFRPRYLPLLMVYFAYGALGLVAVAQTFWIKKSLTLTPAELAAIAVWLNVPWTVKMVFGELVDSVAFLGSRRRGYVFLGGGMVAAGMLILAGAASGTLRILSPEKLYFIAALVITLGVVLQDVVADAMSTEVVDRVAADGTPRAKADIDRDLGMVQVLGRLAIAFGAFAVAWLGGFLASVMPYHQVFLLGLLIPAISVSGALMVRLETPEARAIDWRILGGGLAFGAFVVTLGLSRSPVGQEIVFLVSLGVVIWMLSRIVGDIDERTRLKIAFAALLIFLFRSSPNVGQGYTWFSIDRLGFDEAFLGTLGQIGAGVAIVATWLLSDAVTRKPVPVVLLWLTVLGAILALPGLALTLGVHEWTERVLGFGARTIAVIDSAAASPLAQLGMVPMLTLIAIYAPAGRRATWFALMASLMNLALAAGELQTKYLNLLLPVERGQYDNLPLLTAAVLVIGLLVPLAAILLLGRRVR
jgi:hypothetical protein